MLLLGKHFFVRKKLQTGSFFNHPVGTNASIWVTFVCACAKGIIPHCCICSSPFFPPSLSPFLLLLPTVIDDFLEPFGIFVSFGVTGEGGRGSLKCLVGFACQVSSPGPENWSLSSAVFLGGVGGEGEVGLNFVCLWSLSLACNKRFLSASPMVSNWRRRRRRRRRRGRRRKCQILK